MRRSALAAHRFAVSGQVARQMTLEDVEVTQRNPRKRSGWNPEVLGQNVRRRVGEPVRQEERRELRGMAFVEAQEELAAVRREPLQRVRKAGREIPQVTLFHVRDIGAAGRVENGDAATAIDHVGPFGKLMPMHLADAARSQAHVDAGDGVRNREIRLRDLARPTAVLNAPWRTHC